MKEVPTAEALLNSKNLHTTYHPSGEPKETRWHDSDCPFCDYVSEVEEAMIEFAKLHVEAALEAAVNSARTEAIPRPPTDSIIIVVNKDSILNSYPLTNIK
jgi:hypothetical protein